MDTLHPDFITYAADDLPDERILRACKDNHMPLLGWISDRNANKQEDIYCDCLILEGTLDP